MHANPSSLDTRALAACLRQSAGEERDRQVDFLRYLDPFDAREAWREAGYGSLWSYCLGELALREGAAGRRIGAMRVLREFPGLEAPLRDGRLSLTTAVTLRPVLTRENLEEMVAWAAYKSDEETRHLVASLQPRLAPREGIRRMPEPAPRPPAPAPEPAPALARNSERDVTPAGSEAPGDATPAGPEPFALALAPRPPSRPFLEPLSADRWSMRVTIDGALKGDLETLRCLLSHKVPDGNLAAVLQEAVRCAIAKHGKRRGMVRPEPRRSQVAPEPGPREREAHRSGEQEPGVAEVKRAVWQRDGGRCTYASPEGRLCDCRRWLEFDHIQSAALGGRFTTDNVRLRCRAHNALHAEETFGREHMARFRQRGRPELRTVGATIASESALGVASAAAGAGARPLGAGAG